MKTEFKLGFWFAIFSSLFAILWFITFNMQDFFQPVPEWKNLQLYAEKFQIDRISFIYPSLLLALTYLIVLACIHRLFPENKKIWSLVAISIGVLYATMASINYNIQAVSVRSSLAANEINGIEMFLPDNHNSIFDALANSYLYMSLSMFSLGFGFGKNKSERWIRWVLLLQIITAIGQAGYTMFDMNENIFIATSMIWVIGAPLVFILLAVWFRKSANLVKTTIINS